MKCHLVAELSGYIQYPFFGKVTTRGGSVPFVLTSQWGFSHASFLILMQHKFVVFTGLVGGLFLLMGLRFPCFPLVSRLRASI